MNDSAYLEHREILGAMNLNNMSENLREDLGENEAISQLAELRVGRNNVKSFER